MTLEPIVRQDTAQVAVAGEDYAIHVIDFAFQPASHRPDVSDARHRLIFVRRDFDPNAVVLGQAKQMVADFEPFRTIGVIDASDFNELLISSSEGHTSELQYIMRSSY